MIRAYKSRTRTPRCLTFLQPRPPCVVIVFRKVLYQSLLPVLSLNTCVVRGVRAYNISRGCIYSITVVPPLLPAPPMLPLSLPRVPRCMRAVSGERSQQSRKWCAHIGGCVVVGSLAGSACCCNRLHRLLRRDRTRSHMFVVVMYPCCNSCRCC